MACAAGWLDGVYWLIVPGSASLAQGCPCALPLQTWAGSYRGGCPPTASYRKDALPVTHLTRVKPVKT